MGVVMERFDVYLVKLNPTKGREIKKTRPCVIISPNSMNRHLETVVIAPMTSKGRPYPCRVHCRFQGKTGLIVLDQIRAVDKSRLVKRLGSLHPVTGNKVSALLVEIFE